LFNFTDKKIGTLTWPLIGIIEDTFVRSAFTHGNWMADCCLLRLYKITHGLYQIK